MRTKLLVSMMLSAIYLLMVAAGAGSAEKPQLDYTVYLPFVAKSCTTHQVAAYLSTSKPVIMVGESMTVTIAVVSDGCPIVGDSPIYLYSNPVGILQPSLVIYSFGHNAPPSIYREASTPLTAFGTGPVTITMVANVQVSDALYNFVYSSSYVVRILTP